LADYHRDAQSKNPAFSVRAFLKKAGISSPSFFKQILEKERRLTPAACEKFLNAMSLNHTEADYFRTLVLFNQAKNSQEKQLHYEQLRSLGHKAKVHIVSSSQYDYYQHWYTPVIRELVCMPSFTGDLQKLSRQLKPSVNAREIKKSIILLEKLELIIKKEDGKYYQQDNLLHTGDEVQSLAIRRFNQQMTKLAGESLDRFPLEERNVRGISFSASTETYKKIEAEITRFHDKILTLLEEEQKAEQVFQLNTMLFPLSTIEEQKKEKS
jgi:uncharacterized protein (TIGR02147 family)